MPSRALSDFGWGRYVGLDGCVCDHEGLCCQRSGWHCLSTLDLLVDHVVETVKSFVIAEASEQLQILLGFRRNCDGEENVLRVDVGGNQRETGYFDVDGVLLKKWEIPTRKREEQGKYVLDDIGTSGRP